MGLLRKIVAFALLVLFTGVVVNGSARAEMVDRIVANVNGEIILYSDVQEQIAIILKFLHGYDHNDPEQRKLLEKDVLTQLIRQKLTEQETKRLKVLVTNAEVETVYQQIIQRNNTTPEQFEKMLKANGQTVEKFRADIKKDLERDRLLERALKSKVVITDQQVDAYLKGEQGSSAATTEKIRLGLILLPVDGKTEKPADVEKKGREVLDKLKSGADFRKTAMQYSKGPAAQEGGDIGFMAIDEMAPFIAKAVKGLKKGETSGLVQGPNGYYILSVLDVDRRQHSKTDPQLREKVRQSLYDKEVNRKFEEWVRALEAKAFIQTSL